MSNQSLETLLPKLAFSQFELTDKQFETIRQFESIYWENFSMRNKLAENVLLLFGASKNEQKVECPVTYKDKKYTLTIIVNRDRNIPWTYSITLVSQWS